MKRSNFLPVQFVFAQALLTIFVYQLIKMSFSFFSFQSHWPVKILKILSVLYLVLMAWHTYRSKGLVHGR
ncbi:MAG: hypothetical protein HYV97_16525 [Bdellovibrio sp.]|nr:hypothetical protein [Bdellovibrio sp.]